MRIARLEVKNYRSIADFDVSLPENVFLIGPNESGKATLLRVVDLLLGSSMHQLYSSVARADFTDASLPLSAEVDLTDLFAEELAAFPDEVDLTKTPQTVTYRLEVENDPNGVGDFHAPRCSEGGK